MSLSSIALVPKRPVHPPPQALANKNVFKIVAVNNIANGSVGKIF